jgi:SAM-dependent methyltransferase
MAVKSEASEWSGDLGRSWRDHLDGLEAMFSPVNEEISSALELTGDERIADIGCGGGGFSRHLAQKLGTEGHITGFDISPDLVAAAADFPSPLPVDFIWADVAHHAVTAPKFDRLTSRFGVMFFPEERAAFGNLASWLKPGGRFAFGVWADFDANPWHSVIRNVVGDIIDIPTPKPGQAGPARYAHIDDFHALLTSVGMTNLSTRIWNGALKLGGGRSAQDAAEFGLSAFWAKDLPVSSAERNAALSALTTKLRPHEVGGEVSMSARVHIVSGEYQGD